MAETLIKLPPPDLKGEKSVEEVIAVRRSVRRYKAEPLTLSQLSQILWAAQGITAAGNYRTIPSAGATFPLEVYALAGEQTVAGLKAGIYHYETHVHSLRHHLDGDLRQKLAEAALNQRVIATCPVNIVVCAIFNRTTYRYGKRGEMYVHMEAGHLGQNIALQTVALGLGTVMVGAFDDYEVSRVLKIKEPLKPLYIIPVGKPA